MENIHDKINRRAGLNTLKKDTSKLIPFDYLIENRYELLEEETDELLATLSFLLMKKVKYICGNTKHFLTHLIFHDSLYIINRSLVRAYNRLSRDEFQLVLDNQDYFKISK